MKNTKRKSRRLRRQDFRFGAEGEIRTLAPVNPVYSLSRGAPYSHLGTSAYAILEKMAEMVGFEPTDALTSTVFKTASLNRSDTSPRAMVIIPNAFSIVNRFFPRNAPVRRFPSALEQFLEGIHPISPDSGRQCRCVCPSTRNASAPEDSVRNPN